MPNVEPLSSPSPAGGPKWHPTPPARPLTGEQSAVLFTWLETSLEAGVKRARRYVEPEDEYDLVGEALTAMLDEMTCESDPLPFPATESFFRARFFTKIRDRGLWYRGDGKPVDHPVSTQWGKAERALPARYSPFRPLWKIFDSLDHGALNVAQDEPDQCAFITRGTLHPGLRSYPLLDWGTFNAELAEFLRPCVLQLPLGQAAVIMETYYSHRDGDEKEPTRKKLAERLGISPKTYDTQHRRALDALRPLVVDWARRHSDRDDQDRFRFNENPWPDIIQAMEDRRLKRGKGVRGGAPHPNDGRRAA